MGNKVILISICIIFTYQYLAMKTKMKKGQKIKNNKVIKKEYIPPNLDIILLETESCFSIALTCKCNNVDKC